MYFIRSILMGVRRYLAPIERNLPQKVEDCLEEFDNVKRESHIGFILNSPKSAVVFHFPTDNTNFVFEPFADQNGRLQVNRKRTNVDIYDNSIHLGCAVTSPNQLLTFAKETERGDGRYTKTSSETWISIFIQNFLPSFMMRETISVGCEGQVTFTLGYSSDTLDDNEREATVILRRPTESKYWVLVFDFEKCGESVMSQVIQAYRYTNGAMAVSCVKEETSRDICDNDLMLGNVQTSPRQLRDFVFESDVGDGRYDVTSNNCQHWIERFTRRRFPDIHQKLSRLSSFSESI